MKQLILAALSLTLAAPAAAWARDDVQCRPVPFERWMNRQQVTEKIEASGLKVWSVEIDDGCYEVTARRKDGLTVELRVDPETGAQVSVDGD